jgi:pimeloyl-ACP methyl ester carboxylesterase
VIRGNRRILVFAFLLLVGSPPARAETGGITPGPGSFIFSFSQGNQVKPIKVWTFGPPSMGPQTKILFVMHGLARDARRYLNPWMAPAHKANVLILAPEFSKQFFPGSHAYNLGALHPLSGEGGMARETTFSAIEKIFDHVVRFTGVQARGYWIYGHSAGGQFVHRLVMLNPDARVDVAVAANAGWYTMPDFEIEFPYGLKKSGVTPSALAKSFGKRLIVLLGEKDNDPRHPSLNRQPAAMKQGRYRLDRGRIFFRRAEREAHTLGVILGWEVKTVPGVAHDNAGMVEAAASLLTKQFPGK